MSQTDIFDTDDGDTPGGGEDNLVTLKRSQIRGIEKKAKEYDSLAKRVELAERRLAFAEAGVPLGDKRYKWFVNGYDGDVNPDAIKQALEESGLALSPPQVEGQTTVDGQVERQAIEQSLSAGDTGRPPGGLTPEQSLLQSYEQGGSAAVIEALRQMGLAQ